MVTFEHYDIGRHKLVPQNLNDLANPQALPAIRLEYALCDISNKDLALVLSKVSLLALSILIPVFHGRTKQDYEQREGNSGSPICIAHSRYHLEANKIKLIRQNHRFCGKSTYLEKCEH